MLQQAAAGEEGIGREHGEFLVFVAVRCQTRYGETVKAPAFRGKQGPETGKSGGKAHGLGGKGYLRTGGIRTASTTCTTPLVAEMSAVCTMCLGAVLARMSICFAFSFGLIKGSKSKCLPAASTAKQDWP